MRVIISAGGTGGHIYPALAIINKIKKEDKTAEFLYIGTDNRMEKDLIPSFNIPYEQLHVTGLDRKNILNNFKTINNLFVAIKKCKKIIKDFKPDIVIGCGGYVTVPVIISASKLKVKTIIHEQNSVVGLANKFLSKYVDKVMVSFPESVNLFKKDKAVLTGNPCSSNAVSLKKQDIEEYKLSNDKDTVLIVMGSLGSKTINDMIYDNLNIFKDKNYQVLFVTGNSYYEKLDKVKEYDNVKVVPFIYELPRVMKSASLMVSRSGASTIAEIEAVNIPTIFIPSPYVTNNHQYKNAVSLVNKDAGVLIEEKDLTIDKLISNIDNLLLDKKRYSVIKKNLKDIGIKDSDDRVYKVIKEVTKE